MASPAAAATPWNPNKAVGLHFQNGQLVVPGQAPIQAAQPASSSPQRRQIQASYAQQPWNGPRNNNGLPSIAGYENSGIQTDRFQQQNGRAPTASDYERQFGGLSPEHDQIGSLSDFYARNTTDPVTGLKLLPSQNERMQQQASLQKKGDFEGLGAVDSYYGARQTGSPAAMGQAAAGVNNLKASRQFLQSISPTAAPAAAPSAPWEIHANNDIMTPQPSAPFPTGPTVSGGINYATGDPGALAKGGNATGMRPYITGEKGNELWTGADGQQKMLGMDGPEMDTFSEPGYVTPHNRLPPRLQLMGKNPNTNGEPTVPEEMGIPHRFTGGMTQPSMRMPDGPGASQGDIPVSAIPYNYEQPDYTAVPMTTPRMAAPAAPPTYVVPPSVQPQPPQFFRQNPNVLEAQGIAPLPFGNEQFNFDVPRGTIGVTPTRTNSRHLIGGIPVSDFFQNEANAQGEANKFASPEEGYVKPAADYRRNLIQNERMRQIAKETAGLPAPSRLKKLPY